MSAAPSTREIRSASSTIGWNKAYSQRLLLTDALVLIWVVFGVQIAWFGIDTANVAFRGDLRNVAVNYTAISLVVIALWLGVLGLYGSRADRVIGTGSTEYKLIIDVSLRVFGLLAILAFLFHIDLARGYILIAFPVGVLVLVFSRWLWRQWLVLQRAQGRYSAQVLLVGSRETVEHFARQLMSQPSAGYHVVGACVSEVTGGTVGGSLRIPVIGSFDDLEAALVASHADTVVITSSDHLPPERVRQLSWSLEPGGQHLVVAPSLTDIGGPRIHTRPVAGFPLIHVETPTYAGQKLFSKRLFDMVVGAVLVLLVSPILLLVALVIKLGSQGPVFFLQERVGLNGGTFKMIKFRSMVVDAEARLSGLVAGDRTEGNAVLFKMKDDPRVTPVGRFLRRYSIDELPQLFNVVVGDMALVGPRPPLAREVEHYETHVHRRFLVKPGITGLWQTSGRSNLSWEDSVRLDLYYVENWSMAGDLIILWRTLRAVLAREGAF
jgi:exopolysaccharide biosynthesis polyprenyl glycosylphosphotransferase